MKEILVKFKVVIPVLVALLIHDVAIIAAVQILKHIY